ncbi:M24 family metallopeptidase [Agrococcus sp. SGAir0287]|uniref:M24 family metallopeptidase n=1 Tax=Agrococcus sp. SGAir0287 TaxID=2070347 RepID=UPI0010CD6937|nr:M24 family metallopeptidase [Agrococcus sp. SGAir0287]QCR19421.1 creatinase [Agrococcus sp. SGAir0287]
MSFDPDELAARLVAVRRRMAEAGLDALLVADPANIHYLTGYDAWSFYMPQVLLVTHDAEPVLALRAMDANGAHRTAQLPTSRILGYPESWVHQADRHPFAWIVAALRERGLVRAGRVGVETEAHFLTVRSYLALGEAAPEWRLVDDHQLVNWVRLVKSTAELERMREAGRVCTAAMLAGFDAIRPGMGQHELAAVVAHAQAMGVDGVAGDYPAIVPMLPTGESADTPHMTYSGRVLEAGEAVSFEIAGVSQRYHAPLARTVSLGEPSRALRDLASMTADGLSLVLDGMVPGATLAEVHGIWQAHLHRAGYEKASRLGYSIGIGYPPDWGEHTVSVRGDDETPLQPGMTLHVIAGMWMTGFGCELSESVAVTESGVELLTHVPRELVVR